MTQAVQHNDTRSLWKTVNDRQAFGTADLATRPVKSAEVAQARVFEKILQAEFAQLTRVYSAAGLLNRPDAKDVTRLQPSQELVRIHARINEVHRLLQGLKGWFELRPDELRPDEWCTDSA